MSTWEERMSIRAAQRRLGEPTPPPPPELVKPDVTGKTNAEAWDALNAAYQKHGRELFESLGLVYDPADHDWSQVPPPSLCLQCYEWRRYPTGQRHFGLAGWRVCAQSCDCAHHADEVAIA